MLEGKELDMTDVGRARATHPARSRASRWSVVLGALLVAGAVTAPDAAVAVGPPLHFKEFSQGAVVSWTSCPGEEPPPVPTVCHEYKVWYFRGDGVVEEGAVGPLDRAKAQFQVQYEDLEHLSVPDEEGVDLSWTLGESADVVGYYDKTHLTRAGMNAVTLPLTRFDIVTGAETPAGNVSLGAFAWTAASPVYTFGNDGPVFDDRPHESTRCETFNANAHQRFTLGSVTGTVDGVPISDLATIPQVPDLEPAGAVGGIFNNWFRIVDVDKGCAE